MTRHHAALAGVALAFAAATGPAQAGTHDRMRTHRTTPLPPLSGTLHLGPGAFASGRAFRHYRLEDHRFGETYGGRRLHAGYDAARLRDWGYGQGSVYWNRSVPYYGEGNDTAALIATGWGTADSATTGGSYPLPSTRYHSPDPVQFSYGVPFAPAVDRDSYSGAYHYGTAGGLGSYNSGSAGRLAYYSSGSSAGPGGTPGGLAIYSSGSFGPGAEVLRLGHHRAGQWSRGASGPHIIHVHDVNG